MAGRKKKTPSKKKPRSKTTSAEFDPRQYVRDKAAKNGQGCAVCARPDIKEQLARILAECRKQNVTISKKTLQQDLIKRWHPWRISEKKFSDHIAGTCRGNRGDS